MKKILIIFLILLFIFAFIRITTSIYENKTREQRAELKTSNLTQSLIYDTIMKLNKKAFNNGKNNDNFSADCGNICGSIIPFELSAEEKKKHNNLECNFKMSLYNSIHNAWSI